MNGETCCVDLFRFLSDKSLGGKCRFDDDDNVIIVVVVAIVVVVVVLVYVDDKNDLRGIKLMHKDALLVIARPPLMSRLKAFSAFLLRR